MSKIADIYGVNGSGLASLRFAALSSHLKLKEEGTSLWEVVLWVQIHLSHLKTSGVSGPKARPPIVPSSFSLRCEERAAKRKEFFQKLEEKTNAKILVFGRRIADGKSHGIE
ncbi:unnamed protein product [Camellia sinensis]